MTLKLNGSSSGYTAIDAPAAAGSNTLTLPADNGSDGEVLKTNGSGVLDWTAPLDNTPAFHADASGGNGFWFTGGSCQKQLFKNDVFDTDGAYDAPNSKFTVPSGKGGKYQVNFMITVDDVDDGGYCYGRLYKNGSSVRPEGPYAWSPGSGKILTATHNFIITLAAGDYVEVYGYHSASGDQGMEENQNHWSMFRLAGV